MLDQLPRLEQRKIYTEFLFKDFLKLYKRFFLVTTDIAIENSVNEELRLRPTRTYFQSMYNLDLNMKLNFLDVDNDKYKDLLACILRYMEPNFLETN